MAVIKLKTQTLQATPQHATPAWLNRRPLWTMLVSGLLLIAGIAVLCIGLGSVAIPPLVSLQILLKHLAPGWISVDIPASYTTIVLELRLPRVALVALTGASLASAGCAYQSMFRNPLADPYLIGVASGAGLGVIVAMTLRTLYPTSPLFLLPIAAFSGASLAVALVYALGRTDHQRTTTSMLLAGVAINALTTAVSTLLLLRLSHGTSTVLAFLFGGYSNASWQAVLIVGPLALLGYILVQMHARDLNLMLFDDDQARQLGIQVERVRLEVIIAATLMTSIAVAFSGLIGFVGLIVPHAMRMLIGGDQRRLLPMTAIGGAGFLLLTDLAARTLLTPEEIPLGVVTALVGTPFFLWLLRR